MMRLAVLLALAALPAAAQETPDLREPFRAVLTQPGLGGLALQARVQVGDDVVDCDIRAVVDHPPQGVMELLGDVRGWCDTLLLHPNVKACVREPGGEVQRMRFHLGTKHFQPAALSRPQRYALRIERREEGFMALRLQPEETVQAGRADGAARIEVVAIEGGRTGVRLRYREPLGAGARLLAAAYFATFGRDKVGFSTAGVDAEGRPVLIGGLAGAIERNAVRHFLAVETHLAAKAADADMPLERRLAHWFALSERHARQLHELDWAEYLDIKLREFAQSAELQRQVEAGGGD